MEKGILRVQKSESGRRCNERQSIIKSNIIKSIKNIITRRGENDERTKAILNAPKLNSSDISLIER